MASPHRNRRRLEVRPWNVKAGDEIFIYDEIAKTSTKRLVRSVSKSRGHFSGLSRWEIYDTIGRRIGSYYGDERVTIYREKIERKG